MGPKADAQVARRAVFDTGVVVSALIFSQGRLGWLRQDWREGHAVPLVSQITVEELLRVFAYPKFRLTREARDELLAEYLPYAEVVPPPKRAPRVPACRDPDDRAFLELAVTGDAEALVTGDDDLLALAREFAIPILRPEAWRVARGRQ